MPYNHEAEVEAFMATARMSDPERYAVICSKYQVKSRRQMRTIAEIEIPVGLYPGKLALDQPVGGVVEATPALLEEIA